MKKNLIEIILKNENAILVDIYTMKNCEIRNDECLLEQNEKIYQMIGNVLYVVYEKINLL